MFIGGAPCNVGVHLSQLGHSAQVATRVGEDQLGEEITGRLAERGVGVDLIQTDSKHRTGFVKVVFRGTEPSYEIVQPSAWDFIEARWRSGRRRRTPPSRAQRGARGGLCST